MSLALVGIVFGWQAMLGTATLLLAACLVQALIWSAVIEWPTVPAELLLVPAAFLHLVFWRPLVEGLGGLWPSAHPTPACLAIPVAMALAVAGALAAIAPAPCRRRPSRETAPGQAGDQPA